VGDRYNQFKYIRKGCMSKKKESVWTMGNKGPTGPWVWHAWIKDSKKPVRVVAFDMDHIRCQVEPKQVIKVKRLPEEKDESSSMPLGPKGCTVNQPADYDKGFKILKAWLDTQDGPPESVRQELRELFIDYDRVERKKKK
jgi:hypothetical protein